VWKRKLSERNAEESSSTSSSSKDDDPNTYVNFYEQSIGSYLLVKEWRRAVGQESRRRILLV
jgi:hypothetical protein